jgi:hypothetical protein
MFNNRNLSEGATTSPSSSCNYIAMLIHDSADHTPKSIVGSPHATSDLN